MKTASEGDRTAQTIRLEDGRTLAYAEYGDPSGTPVLEFHGWPGCRFEAKNYDEAGKKLGARVIGVDRPGFGLSSYKKSFRIVDWPSDVTEFADALGTEKFPVMGISSGSPYALVCGRFLSDRLTSCTVVAGLPPLKVPGEKLKPAEMIEKTEVQIASLANTFAPAARLAFWYVMRQMRKDPEKALKSFTKHMPDSDLKLMEDESAKEEFRATMQECVRHGNRGAIASVGLELKPWGFRLEDISMHVTIWQGDSDNLVNPASARYMASKIPDCDVRWIPGAGHLSSVATHADEVLAHAIAAG